MNKIGKSLLLASLMVGVANADTNKTFLAGRPAGVNTAMEGTTWHTQVNTMMAEKQYDEKIGSSLQVIGFYRENTNESDLGRYFGFDNKRTLFIGQGGATGVDIDRRALLHDSGTEYPDPEFTGTLNLSYQHSVGGIYLCYQQDLDKHMKGLYYKVRTPIVWEESRARLGVAGDNPTVAVANTDDAIHRIANYFAGTLTQTNPLDTGAGNPNKQAALQYARIDDASHSRAGVADIDVVLGWSFKETDNTHAAVNFGFTIPTSPSPDGVYLSGRQVGNRGHWGIGGGFDMKMTPWKDEDWKLEIDCALDWRFLFRDWEVRTLGLRDANGIKNWGHYLLLGKANQKGVFPAANILTQRVSVRPGNQIDGRLGLAFSYSDFTFDLGYNLYWREREQLDWDCGCFPESTYAIAYEGYDGSSNNFVIGNAAAEEAGISDMGPLTTVNGGSWITAYDVDASVAETPWQLTHKVYGGIGYAFNAWDAPIMLGIGGAYEFASDQKALENWEIWGKVGLSF